MSAQVPTPEAAPVRPSRAKIALHAFVVAVTSKQAQALEFALARYVAYAVLGALGVKHASILGL